MSVDVLTEVVIDRPCALVAGYAADPSHAPDWYANIVSVSWLTPPPVGVGSRMDFVARFLGRRLSYTYEVVAFEAGQRLVMRTARGPFPMETTYTWQPVDAGRTRMTLRNRGAPAGFGKVAGPVMAAAMRRANLKDLAALKHLLENGAAASTVKVVTCACGQQWRGTLTDLVSLVQAHGRQVHNMDATPEQVAAMAVDADTDSPQA
ncbi:MAG TPA: SRPBCC family protein [Rugosimonospora sp.]|nr:SRPBCC family protein [Rugosimonospora sp.]